MTTLILSVFFSISASAGVVEVDGIYYDISGTTATVTSGEKEYSGDIVIPESITFENSKYSVTSIGDWAFDTCENIENVYCYAEVVPSTDVYAFYNSDIEKATLHVPASAIEAYKTTAPWSDFGTIKAIPTAVGSLRIIGTGSLQIWFVDNHICFGRCRILHIETPNIC